MLKAGIIGATGYTGGELLKILANHPEVEPIKAASRSNAGNQVSNVHKFLYKALNLEECTIDTENFTDCDVVFLALPHGASSQSAKELVSQGVKVVDLGADFRLRTLESYNEWYGAEHKWPEVLADTVYGLPEIYRERIKDADLVANPGCYPTSIILGLMPLLKNNLVDVHTIVADSKSGVSGAGKTPTANTHYPDMNDGISAYKIAGHHRHTAEIEQELGFLAGEEMHITFTPHLTPMTRGILSSITVTAKQKLSQKEIDECYYEAYKDEYFIRLRSMNDLPNTKWVAGSNYCDIAAVWDERTGRVNVISVIDNLVKGASGQAVQNMNLMFGLEENAGLKLGFIYP